MKKFLFLVLVVVMMLLSSAMAYGDNVFCSPDTVYTVREIGHSDTEEFYIINTTQDTVDFILTQGHYLWNPEPQNGIVPPNDSLLMTIYIGGHDEYGYCRGGGNYLFRYDTSDPVDSIISVLVIDSTIPPDPPDIEILSPVGGERYDIGDTMHVEIYASYTGCRGQGGFASMESSTGEYIWIFELGNTDFVIPELDDTLFRVLAWINDFGDSDYDETGWFYIRGTTAFWPQIRNVNNSPSNPEPYEPCTISATILDADGIVDSASVYYNIGSGYNCLTMNNASDSFFVTLPWQLSEVVVDYYIAATDDSGHTVVSDTFSYSVLPLIGNVKHIPFYPEPYETCTISSTIINADGVIDSAILFHDAGEGYSPLTMSNISDSFFVDLPGQPDQTTVDYYIAALDSLNNTTVSDTFSYSVYIHQGPMITDVVRNPLEPGHMESCEVSAIIQDPFLSSYVSRACVNYNPGTGYSRLFMSNNADSFYATIPAKPGGTTIYYYIEAVNNIDYPSYSDTFSYYITEQYCLSCSATTSTPSVPNSNGIIMWDMDVYNCGLQPMDVYGEIYPTIGDCAGTQYNFDLRNHIINDLAPGESFTGYYYYQPDNVSGITDAALSISLGIWYEYWSTNCCFEFTFTYPWGRTGDQIIIEPGIWGDADDMPIIPEVTDLLQNYPNPFNASTTISFDLAQAGNVVLGVYNLSGQKIETLVDKEMQAGQHHIDWDASTYSSGIYFYKLTTYNKTFTKRMTLLK
ncbi:MAG: T9SS type A sorting domain-containing protein [candidate division Zixibacteria bacterium]|nr:T9SS type A sorting domain-containing protein [candidate division Zixibacteria bacterium]